MDITSFLMGFQKGRTNAPALKTQEKSIEITENGTTEVLPDVGYLLSKVLVTANIASGGGGDKTPIIKFNSFAAANSGNDFTITDGVATMPHGLGVVPDIVFLFITTPGTLKSTTFQLQYGISEKMMDAVGDGFGGRICVGYSNGSSFWQGVTVAMENSTDELTGSRGCRIRGATETTIMAGSSSYPILDNVSYGIVSIGNLV